jgi:signal transduction histidine kinase
LDESAVEDMPDGPEGPEAMVGILTEYAPVVLVADGQVRESLAFLINSSAVDVVPREQNFVVVTASLVARRAGFAFLPSVPDLAQLEPSRSFGELLRHEVNNPLTGILGNAELLLKRRDGLSSQTVARLETIAELAVRLRETIRRLSDYWEARHDSVRVV